MKIKLTDLLAAPIEREFSFGVLKFTPLNLDYWLRLESEYGITLEDSTTQLDAREGIERTLSMLHCASYQYVKDAHDRDAWSSFLLTQLSDEPALVGTLGDLLKLAMPDSPKEKQRPKP